MPQGTAAAYQADEHWYPYFGQIVEMEPETGDVNLDGSVSIMDVTDLLNYLISGNARGINLTAADCDLDGSITIDDVTVLIDYLLSGTWK